MAKRKSASKSPKKTASTDQFPLGLSEAAMEQGLIEALLSGAPDRQAIMDMLKGVVPPALLGNLGQQIEQMGDMVDQLSEEANFVDPKVAAKMVVSIDKKLVKSPNNVDLLEERARLSATIEESVSFMERAVAAAEKKLGNFDRYVGVFWADPKTRPYMNARLRLGAVLSEAGRYAESISHYQGLLLLNPGDNQGIRYQLLKQFVDRQEWEQADELIAQYPDDGMADFCYTAVLLEFRRSGDSEASKSLLKEAIKSNPHVVREMLCEEPDSDAEEDDREAERMGRIVVGGISEARDHAIGFRGAWRIMPGAISWLRTASHSARREIEEAAPKKKVSLSAKTKQLKSALAKVRKLPEDDDAWIVDIVGKSKQDQWGLLVASETRLRPIATEETSPNVSAIDVALQLCDIMLDPDDEEMEPCRPNCFLLVDESRLEELREYFEPSGIDVEMHERAEELRRMSSRVSDRRDLPEVPLADVPQSSDMVWEVDWQRANTWVTSETGELVQPWVIMVIDVESRIIIQTAMESFDPTPELLDRILRAAVLIPAVGDSLRPAKVKVRSGDNKLMLLAWLKEADVDSEIGELPTFDEVFEGMEADLHGDARPGLIELEDVEPELVGELYEVSARYFRAAPWKTMRPTDLVSITCPAISKKTWYATGMGQNGEGLGFMLFDNDRSVRGMFSSSPDMADFSGLSLTLEEKHLIAPSDVAAAEQFGWPVATAESWPMVAQVSPEGFEDPTPEDIPLLIAAARVILDFWKSPAEARRRGAASLDYPMQIGGQPVTVKAKLFVL